MTIITDEKCAGYFRAGHPERPQRILATVERLKNQKELPIEWILPSAKVSDEQILRAHSPEMLARLKSPHDFDADTPAYENISEFARASVAAGIDAMKLCRAGKNVFSLMRPPGHHATREQQMGFCYLNNVAIAALEAIAPRSTISSPSPPPTEERAGVRRQKISNPLTPTLSPSGRGEGEKNSAKRVAVFDFDVHHGNGTEDILLNRDGVAFFSVHQFPCYPGTGQKNIGNNCFNYPVAPKTPRENYRDTLARALNDVKNFSPELIAVSAGFDAYARDPLADGTLLAEDFYWIGKELRALKISFFSLLEGGYSDDLPDLILAYLKGVRIDSKLNVTLAWAEKPG